MPLSPWMRNEYGTWCIACGYCLSSDPECEGVEPDSCEQCGFPDFEEGTGYFTDDEDEEHDCGEDTCVCDEMT